MSFKFYRNDGIYELLLQVVIVVSQSLELMFRFLHYVLFVRLNCMINQELDLKKRAK